MLYLLIALLISWGLTFVFYKMSDRPGDDFGAVFPLILFLALSSGLTLVYVVLVFWNHRFL